MECKPTAVAIFVKTPGLSPLKTRLASSIGHELAEEFHVLSAAAVQAIVKATRTSTDIVPVWAVAEEDGLADPLWSELDRIWQGDGDLADRLDHIYSTLQKQDQRVILIGADTAQLTVEILVEAHQVLAKQSKPQFVIGRADDGGFYLFGGNIGIPGDVWRTISYSEPTTVDELLAAIRTFGPVHELPTLTDVDVFDDLEPMADALANLPAPLGEQIRLQQWIARLLMDEDED